MALVNQTLKLEITPGGVPPKLHVTEYDENMQVVARLFQRGQYYEIPSGTTAKVEGTLAGHPFSADATVDGSNVTFELTKSMTAYAGRAWTKIKLTKDGKPVSTCGFWLECDRAGVEAGDVIGAPGFEEQIKDAVIASGLSETAKALIITILRNGVYIIDQSANITALENALASGGSGDSGGGDTGGGDTETVTYTITNNLTNCSNSNTAATIAKNSAYTAVITAVDGYELDSVVVTMGGIAVAVTGGVISIDSVTGNIVITATAVEASTGGDTSTSNLINFNGGTIITNGTGTATILDDHSAIIAGGFATAIVNGLSPGSHYSFNFDGGASFSIYGSRNDNITAEPEPANMVQIRPNGNAAAGDLPYMFTLPNTCRALLISIYTGTWSNMVLEKQVNPLEGSPYEFTFIENEYPDKSTGEIKSYTGWTRTDFTPCRGVSAIRTYQSGNGKDSRDTAFYDENKNFISGGFYVIGGSPISVPDNAHYFILSGEPALMNTLTVIPIAKEA